MLDSMQRSSFGSTATNSSMNFIGVNNKDDLCSSSSSSEQQTHLYISRTDQFPGVSYKWNSNEEIASILLSVEYHPEWITKSVQTRPTNGSLLIYHKKECNYKQDGYLWKKRKVGKLPREDHMRLKVKGVESIYANYVHSALVPTFHRRSYWLLSNPEHVLIHYLNVPNEIDQQHERLILSLRQYASNLSREEILDQLQPMLCRCDESSAFVASGETSHNNPNNNNSTVEHLTWLNSLIDESRKPKYTPGSIASGVPGTGNPVSNFLLVGYADVNSIQNLSDSSISPRPLLVSIEPSNVDNSGSSTVILSTSSSSPIAVMTSSLAKASQDAPRRQSLCQQQQQCFGDNVDDVDAAMKEPLQLQSSGASNARSNSCGSASRKIFSALSLKRQPSAFSDGAQDVFLPGVGVDYSSATSVNNASAIYGCTHNNDSAYCSFADGSSVDDVRAAVIQDGSVGVAATDDRQRASAADPLLTSSALNGVAYHDSDVETNGLGLSREEINEILKVNFVDSNDGHGGGGGVCYDAGNLGVAMSDCFGSDGAFRIFGNYLNNYDTTTNADEQRLPVNIGDGGDDNMQISSGAIVGVDDNRRDKTSRDDSRRSSCASVASYGVGINTEALMSQTKTFNDASIETCFDANNVVVATITEYSPDWSFIEGGVKILISGPWYSDHHGYKCKFDKECVSAVFVQSGVLRCHCPPHEAGTVSLCVLCDDRVISNSVTFSYVERKSSSELSDNFRSTFNVNPDFWISANDNHFANGLLERLYFLESQLSSHNRTTNACHDANIVMTTSTTLDFTKLEQRFVALIEKMSTFDWRHLHQQQPSSSSLSLADNVLSHHCGLTLLHFCAVLGYVDAITALCRWYGRKPNDCLKIELDPARCDANGRTPLMLSCIRGRVAASVLLARWCRDSLFTSDKHLSELPLALAYRQGHIQLIKEVVEQFVREANGDPSGKDLDTALWVLTGGLVERSQLFGRQVVVGVDNRRVIYNQQKQHSLDALLIQQHQQQQRALSNATFVRGERVKRSSVEGVDDLIRTTDDCVVSCSNKLTKQNSREEQSVHAVEEWLKQPLNVDVPMDLASSVPESPSCGMAWDSITDGHSECCMDDDQCPTSRQVPPNSGGGAGATLLGVEIASLAQEIIDALPDRIKAGMFFEEADEDVTSSSASLKAFKGGVSVVETNNRASADFSRRYEDYDDQQDDDNSLKDFHPHSVRLPVEAPQLSPLSLPRNNFVAGRNKPDTPCSSPPGGDFFNFHNLECDTPSPVSSIWMQQSQLGSVNTNFFGDARDLSSPNCSSTNCRRKCSTPGSRATDLGAFFNASRSRSPLECHFQELTLSDREQRELYEAAKVIQNAFRQYKKRVQNQRQIEMERHAATVIQTYYRRYKQYCYFKKLHHAAALIQKHFRLYKAGKRRKSSTANKSTSGAGETKTTLHLRTNATKSDHNYDTTSHVFMNSTSSCCDCGGDSVVMTAASGVGGCIRIAVTPEELRLWKRQLAAIRIQHAFRGHIKRQAAARTIQRFMRQSKQKLQKARIMENIADVTELTTLPLGYLNTPLND